MRRRGRFLSKFMLLVLLTATAGAAFWFGLVPQRLSPFAPVTLDQPSHWFLDFRLAALKRNPELCQAVLKAPMIESSPIPDQPYEKGCGWVNAVKVPAAAGVRINTDKLTCEMAAALALWLAHEVQPLAQELFGKRVTSIVQMGTYSCRNIIGNAFWKDVRSEHAKANALDIGGFTLEDGRQISVLKDWKGADAEAKFLKAVHASACRYFRVTLGPEFNPSHKDHLHLDRGFMWSCK